MYTGGGYLLKIVGGLIYIGAPFWVGGASIVLLRRLLGTTGATIVLLRRLLGATRALVVSLRRL